MIRRLAPAYFGGALGAVVNSAAVWLAGRTDLTAALGVALAPEITWAWLSPRLLWGSLWGLGYPLVLRWGFKPVRAGLVLSLAPSLAQLFYFLPQAGHGMLGVSRGALMPVVVLLANAVWGWALGALVGATQRPHS